MGLQQQVILTTNKASNFNRDKKAHCFLYITEKQNKET